MGDKKEKSILSHFASIGIGSALSIILSFLMTPIITRTVDPDVLGNFSIYTGRVGIVSSLFYFGLNDALLRFYFSYKTKKEKIGLLKMCTLIPLGASIIASVIIVFLSIVNINFINANWSTPVMIMFSLNIIAAVCNYQALEMLQNTKQSSIFSLATLMQKIVYFSIAVTTIFIKNGHFYILIVSNLLSVATSTLIAIGFTKEYWAFKGIDFPKDYKDILKYSIPIYIYFFIYSVYDVFDKLQIEKHCSDYEVGLYTSVFSIVGVFAIVQTAFATIWKPIQTEHYIEKPDDRVFISKGNRYMTITMFFFGAFVMAFKDILVLFVGEKYRSAASVIPFLVFNPIINTLIGTVTSGIEVSKRSYLRVLIILITLLSEVLLCNLLIPTLGINGAAISMALSLIVQYYLTVFFSNRFYFVDYGIKKSIILVITTVVFAFVNTSIGLSYLTFIILFIYLIALYVLYKKDIVDFVLYIKQSVIKNN